ncbi:hypothetical protein LPJ56_001623 [Coemansia sp. RSA 2599]|nr:hypothetical protein LPJ56_001623 [Coemansia sp. RSA 2599]
MQVIPTSSEPRVISVNVVLPTFAIKITEDPNSLSMATVLSIDPNMEVASVTPTLDTPIPIFGTPEIATKKALGRLALDMDDPRFTATMDQPEFTQSLVTRTVNKNRASGRQRHEITIDDYDLAGILRMTNLASLASQLLLSNGVSDLAALDLPTLSPALAGPVFSTATAIPLVKRAAYGRFSGSGTHSVAPLIMQDTNTVIYTPIIPFITDGTRRETPTPNAVPVNDAKGGINASGIASILQDVFHIPPSAISIDGKPLAAGGSGSGRMDGKKDGDSDSDDDGDNDGNSDDEDSGSAAQGEPQDLEKELQSRLGIEMNKNRNRDRFRAHIKIIGASIKDKGRHADLVKGIPGNKAEGGFRGMIKGKGKSKHRGSTLLAVDSDSDSSDDDASSGNLSQSVRSQMSTAGGSHTTIDMVDGTPTIILDSRSDMGADTESSTATDKIPFSTSSSIEDIDDQTSKFEMIIEDENDSRSNA